MENAEKIRGWDISMKSVEGEATIVLNRTSLLPCDIDDQTR